MSAYTEWCLAPVVLESKFQFTLTEIRITVVSVRKFRLSFNNRRGFSYRGQQVQNIAEKPMTTYTISSSLLDTVLQRGVSPASGRRASCVSAGARSLGQCTHVQQMADKKTLDIFMRSGGI